MSNQPKNDAAESGDARAGEAQPPHLAHDVQEIVESLLSPAGEDMAARLGSIFGDTANDIHGRDDIPAVMVDSAVLHEVARLCKEDPGLDLKLLHCLFAVDYEDRIQIVYVLFSVTTSAKMMLKVDLPSDAPVIDSVSDLWEAAGWFERETHDLFGVQFAGNSDLSPLLLFEGFDGHPGLKSYPLHEYDEY